MEADINLMFLSQPDTDTYSKTAYQVLHPWVASAIDREVEKISCVAVITTDRNLVENEGDTLTEGFATEYDANAQRALKSFAERTVCLVCRVDSQSYRSNVPSEDVLVLYEAPIPVLAPL